MLEVARRDDGNVGRPSAAAAKAATQLVEATILGPLGAAAGAGCAGGSTGVQAVNQSKSRASHVNGARVRFIGFVLCNY